MKEEKKDGSKLGRKGKKEERKWEKGREGKGREEDWKKGK